MRIFVTGGTGAIGSHTVPALVRAGHSVTAIARSDEKAAQLVRQGAEPVSVSLFDRAALTKAFAGHDAVANLATALPSTAQFIRASAWQANNRIRTEGSAVVIAAAVAAGVSRVVQESVSMLYPDRGSDWIDEEVAPDDFPAAQGNLSAEANTNRFSASGGTGVVLRFGLFYGPGARHAEQLHALACRHLEVILGRPDGFVSSIHLADASAAVVAALSVPAGIYNVVDDEPLTKRGYGDALQAAAGKKAWLRGPGRAADILGHRLTSLTRSLRVSNARFRTGAQWAPIYPSAREGWAPTARALEDGRRRR